MARTLQPPPSLSNLRWFMVRYERESGMYQLAVPSTRETFSLGSDIETRKYFTRIGLEYLGGRAMDSARAFGASQALVQEQRAWGLDLTDPKIDPVVGALDHLLTARRQFGDPDDDETMVL